MDTTLLKGLALLEVLATRDQPSGVTQLADELGLMKSNVHRVLQTLAHAGYAKKEPAGGRYECTLKLWELGARVAERLDVRTVAQPYVRALAERTSETVHLSVLDGYEVLYLDKIDSPQPVRSYSRIGGRAPAYAVATGKALLAHAPQDALKDLAKKLVRHTPRTITGLEALLKDLRRVRETGYAINRGEWRESVHGLASPVFDGTGQAAAALGISGPGERLNSKRIREYAPVVMEAAANVSRALGFHSRVTTR